MTLIAQSSLLPAAGLCMLLAAAPATARTLPACEAGQLTLALDDGQGRFDGMSHSGVTVKITNHADAACSLPTRPRVRFEDSRRRPMRVSARALPGMHPGPVLLPLTVPAHASVASDLRWVSGDVYDDGACVTPAYLIVRTGAGELRAAFHGRLCGPAHPGPSWSATLFKLLP